MNTVSTDALLDVEIDCNFFGYRIVNNITGETQKNVTASFRYRGHEVAFSTHNPAGSKVIVLYHKTLIDEYHSVESAIAAINERSDWYSFNGSARQAAARHRTGRRTSN